MKKILISSVLLLIVTQLWRCNTKRPHSTTELNEVFWVDDIHKYAADNNLIFSGVREGEAEKGLSFYTLGTYSRYSIAEVFDEPYISIKENKRYKLIKLDTSNIGLSSAVYIKGVTSFKNKKVLELESNFQTSWSMASPIAGMYHECYKTLILFDIEENKILFTKVFKRHYEDTHQYDNYNIDSLYQGLYPEDIFEKDTIEKTSTFEWFNYHYIVKENKVEFYKLNENPGSSCNSYSPEQGKEIIAKYVTDKKPEFYYQYSSKKKKWVKKPSTH